MTARRKTVILIAYDGTPNSRRAIHYAGRLLAADRAVVLTVWSPAHPGPDPVELHLDGPPDPVTSAPDIALADAERTNAEGMKLALAAGLAAESLCSALTGS